MGACKVKEILLRTFPYKARILAAKRTFQRFRARSTGGGAACLDNPDEVGRLAIRNEESTRSTTNVAKRVD